MRKYIVFMMLCFGTGTALAGTGYIDPAQQQADIARTAAVAKARASCDARFYHATAKTPNRIATRGEYETCTAGASDSISPALAARGSDAYSKAHYGRMTPAQAEQALVALDALHAKAQAAGDSPSLSPLPGEVRATAIESEAWWIHHNVFHEQGRVPGTPWYVPCKGAVQDATWATQDAGAEPCPLGSGGVRGKQ